MCERQGGGGSLLHIVRKGSVCVYIFYISHRNRNTTHTTTSNKTKRRNSDLRKDIIFGNGGGGLGAVGG